MELRSVDPHLRIARLEQTRLQQEANRELLREIDRRVRDTADLLRVDPMRVIALSARQGLMGKLANDKDQAMKSRLYQLEQNLGTNLPRNRQLVLTNEVLTTLSNALGTAQAALDSRRFDTLKGLNRLSLLREKNEKLMRSVMSQAGARHDRAPNHCCPPIACASGDVRRANAQ